MIYRAIGKISLMSVLYGGINQRNVEVARAYLQIHGTVTVHCQGEVHRVRWSEKPEMLDHRLEAELAMMALSNWKDPPPCLLIYLVASRSLPPGWEAQIVSNPLYDDEISIDVVVRR